METKKTTKTVAEKESENENSANELMKLIQVCVNPQKLAKLLFDNGIRVK